MNQLQKYIWLIDTISRTRKISHKELSDKWERNKNLSYIAPSSTDGTMPLSQTTISVNP